MLLHDYISNFATHTLFWAVRSFTIWMAFWAIRRRGEFDYELDLMGKIVRWAIVVLALFLVQIPGPKLATFRVIVGCVGMAFLVWPNFAYHLTNILKQIFGRKINDDPKELF